MTSRRAVVSKVPSVDPDTANQSRVLSGDETCPGEAAKPLSPAMLDWMRRIQKAGVEMATDEEARKTIAKRLF